MNGINWRGDSKSNNNRSIKRQHFYIPEKNIEFLSVEIKHMNNDTTDLLNFLNEGGTNNEKI